jgi:hypothetical protein
MMMLNIIRDIFIRIPLMFFFCRENNEDLLK